MRQIRQSICVCMARKMMEIEEKIINWNLEWAKKNTHTHFVKQWNYCLDKKETKHILHHILNLSKWKHSIFYLVKWNKINQNQNNNNNKKKTDEVKWMMTIIDLFNWQIYCKYRGMMTTLLKLEKENCWLKFRTFK